jgi:PilZ domain
MFEKDIRRHRRIPHSSPVRISWQGSNGQPQYTRGKCLDVSEDGLRIESLESIPVRTPVSLNADQLKTSGSATVKHVARSGVKYVLGVELSQALRSQALALASGPLDGEKPPAA